MATTTLLALSGPGFDLSDYSLRGLTAELSPIEQSGQIERDCNGNLVDLSAPQFRKYRVRISCSDQESPGFAAISTDAPFGVWPGAAVQVTLPPQLGSADPLTLDCLVSKPWTEALAEYDCDNVWSLELEQE